MNRPAFRVETKINRPVDQVFLAIVDPQELSNYFADQASGSFVAGNQVVWHWDAWGDYPVLVTRVDPDRLIELEIDSTVWKKTSGIGYTVQVRMELDSIDAGTTMLAISESGWQIDAEGLKGSHDNCSGWTHMAMCLKCWLEHGIDLR